MGNATTTLQVTNETARKATVIATVPKQPQVAGVIPANDTGVLLVKRSHPGSVKAKVVVTYDNGDQIEFRFGVEDHDVTDTLVLRDKSIVYNGETRGRLLMSTGRLSSLRRAAPRAAAEAAAAEVVKEEEEAASASASASASAQDRGPDAHEDTDGETREGRAASFSGPPQVELQAAAEDSATSSADGGEGTAQQQLDIQRPKNAERRDSVSSMSSIASSVYSLLAAQADAVEEDGVFGETPLHDTWGKAVSARRLPVDQYFRIESYARPQYYWTTVSTLEFMGQNAFQVKPGLAGAGTISFMAVDKEDCFLCHAPDRSLRLLRRKPQKAFANASSFVRHRDLFHPGTESFELYTRAGYYIVHGSSVTETKLAVAADDRGRKDGKSPKFCPRHACFRLDSAEDDDVSDLAWKYYTMDKRSFVFHPTVLDSPAMVVWVRAKHSATVILAPEMRPTQHLYEIVLGGNENRMSGLRRQQRGKFVDEAVTQGLLTDREFRAFWLVYEDGMLCVGLGEVVGRNQFLTHTDQQPLSVQYIGFATEGCRGEWRLAYPKQAVPSAAIWEVKTPNELEFSYLVASLTCQTLIVWLKAPNSGFISLSPQPQDTDESFTIVLGAADNKQVQLRESPTSECIKQATTEGNQLDPVLFRAFWIDFTDMTLLVGLGNDPHAQDTVLIDHTWPVPRPSAYIGFCTGHGATGEWRLTYATPNVS